jgi:DNA-binding response OmpR family regulator
MSARVLVIEDDEAILKLLRRGLAYEGYQVDTAMDGQSGLPLARDNPPDLVVLDLMLPGIAGLEVCRRLRAVWTVPILISPQRSRSTIASGDGVGADDYMQSHSLGCIIG